MWVLQKNRKFKIDYSKIESLQRINKMNISESNKKLAKYISEAFLEDFEVSRYWDDAEKSHVDILSCPNHPSKNITSYSTIGLSNYPLIHNNKEYPVRLEIVGACDSRKKHLPNMLATAAFSIINSKWFCSPGTIFPDIVKMYYETEMEHILFVPPFLWGDSLKTIELSDKKVAWLLAVPISEKERLYAKDKGEDALESLFEKEQIDIYDLNRKSTL
jgi:hypothetical protein